MRKRQPARTRHSKQAAVAEADARPAKRRSMPKLRYVPLETVNHGDLPGGVERPNTGSAERIECQCGKTYAGCSVVDDPPFIDKDGEWTVARWLYCDHCHVLLLWFELCRADGTLLEIRKGDVAVVRTKKAIEQFLRKHPWAAGINQAG